MALALLGSEPLQRPHQGYSVCREEFLGKVRALTREIIESRLYARDGSITWLRPNRSILKEAPPLVSAGPHLYDGLPGIAVFFAALGRVECDTGYRDLSLEIIAPLRRLLQRLTAEPERAGQLRLGIGGLVGLSSLLYSFVNLGRLLELPELFEEAHRVCSLITSEHINKDRSLDIVSGAPGAILALLVMDRYRSGPTPNGTTPLDAANACADHLLSRRVDRSDGTVVWITNPKLPPLTGFAHGSAGIACALLKLHARTRRQDLLGAALKGLAFERSTYSQEHEDWIDQTSSTLRFLNQWCFGAPGITLGRLVTLDLLEDERIWQEIRAGLRITSSLTLSNKEHICCGDMGRVDVLLYAAEKLREPDLAEIAGDIARRILIKAERKGRFDGLVQSGHRDPSLFSGEAGIGYTLLRLVYPGELPCLLALE